jgi:hypothetical protein
MRNDKNRGEDFGEEAGRGTHGKYENNIKSWKVLRLWQNWPH